LTLTALTETGLKNVVGGGVDAMPEPVGSTTAADARLLGVLAGDASGVVGDAGVADDADATTGDGRGVWPAAVLVDP
jgi:hypothetical protein